MSRNIFCFWILLLTPSAAWSSPGHARDSSAAISVEYDEAESVLGILSKKRANQTIGESDWSKLFSTDAYRLIKERAEIIGRGFTDSDFRNFVLSDSLLEWYPGISKNLGELKNFKIERSVRRALAYLPETTRITAKVYVLIKPTANNFVYFDTHNRPAVFLNLSRKTTPDIIENKLAHELFHVGYSRCYSPFIKEIVRIRGLPPGYVRVVGEVSHFSEGIAMLAAAGGPNVHPHEVDDPEGRARWDNDMRGFRTDLKRIDRFMLDVVRDKLSEAEIETADSAFAGYQGPWYTVGWMIATTVEKTFGRRRLIRCISDPRLFLATYNEAASLVNRSRSNDLPLFSTSLIEWINKR